MKTARSTTTKQNKQGMSKKPRPEIRDDMDSRHRKGETAKSKEDPDKTEKKAKS